MNGWKIKQMNYIIKEQINKLNNWGVVKCNCNEYWQLNSWCMINKKIYVDDIKKMKEK